jgi:acyl dehydratase
MLDYHKLRAWRSPEIRQTLNARDAMLYALGIGLGQDPLDQRQLRYATEQDQQVVPTMAAVLTYPGFWVRDEAHLGIDATKVVHGEQRIEQHRPIPIGVPLVGVTSVSRVVDKGPNKGALVHVEKRIREEASNAAVATCYQVLFCRNDGGFSAQGGGDAPAEPLQVTPERAPDEVVSLRSRPESALVYRLSGDMNPLHSAPDVAHKAGFDRPILQGLATYGMACHGILAAFCDYDVARLRSIAARFSAPVFPGDAIELHCWREGTEVAFMARVPERNSVVLSHGRAICT